MNLNWINAMKTTHKKDVRSFALLVGALLAIYSLWPLAISGLPPRYWPLAVAAIVITLGLVNPLILEPVYRIWMKIGSVLGFINTRIILALGFFAIFTPIGVVMRVLGRDPLCRKYDPNSLSYGIPNKPEKLAHMDKQF